MDKCVHIGWEAETKAKEMNRMAVARATSSSKAEGKYLIYRQTAVGVASWSRRSWESSCSAGVNWDCVSHGARTFQYFTLPPLYDKSPIGIKDSYRTLTKVW